jgi:hypothetical protein
MTRPTVLVAEDSLVIRAVLVEQLQSRGYRVIEADDGEQALAACFRNGRTWCSWTWRCRSWTATPCWPGSRPTRGLPTSRLCS